MYEEKEEKARSMAKTKGTPEEKGKFKVEDNLVAPFQISTMSLILVMKSLSRHQR